jgi:1-aminocyclopropane-1-carboxylate deaminase
MISAIHNIQHPLLTKKKIELDIQRDDLIHPKISGNKYRKLFYTLKTFNLEVHETVISFGGPFSNHLSAISYACKINNIPLVVFVRQPYSEENNYTLSFLKENGTHIVYISKAKYRNLREKSWKNPLQNLYPNALVIPEGGSGDLALKGCEEISNSWEKEYNYFGCSIGTGTTFSGIANANPKVKGLGFVMLKDQDYLNNEISKLCKHQNYQLTRAYNFGGFGKVNDQLIEFINTFYQEHSIPLDPIYTGKMLYGIFDLIEKDYFPEGSKIILIHTGGLQGVFGMNEMRSKKQKSLIQFESDLP